MATINYLITVDNLKQQGIIHNNVDTKLLARCIRISQEMNIQSSTGTKLYKALLTRVANNNWDSDYRTLMDDYVIPALVAWVDYHSALFLNNKVTNKGVGKHSDEAKTSNTDQETNHFQNRLIDIAEHYNNRLIGFLKDNEEVYSEYDDDDCNFEDVQKQKKKGGFSDVVI